MVQRLPETDLRSPLRILPSDSPAGLPSIGENSLNANPRPIPSGFREFGKALLGHPAITALRTEPIVIFNPESFIKSRLYKADLGMKISPRGIEAVHARTKLREVLGIRSKSKVKPAPVEHIARRVRKPIAATNESGVGVNGDGAEKGKRPRNLRIHIQRTAQQVDLVTDPRTRRHIDSEMMAIAADHAVPATIRTQTIKDHLGNDDSLVEIVDLPVAP